MLPPLPLPDHLAPLAREYDAGGREPVAAKDAATVVLIRDGATAAEGPELYLLRRRTSMAFAAGMCVFPGGGVDPRDHHLDTSLDSGDGADWSQRLGTDPATARALVCAAVRETFEESGVLLAGPREGSGVVGLPVDTTGADWEADRAALESHELAFSDFLLRRDLELRPDLLGVWSGWLTPEFEKKRYRTWFFVARLPEGQQTRADAASSESDQVQWTSAAQATRDVEADRVLMLPPTYLTALEIAQYASVDAVMEESRDRRVEMFMPRPYDHDGEVRLTMPPRYADLLRRERGGSVPQPDGLP